MHILGFILIVSGVLVVTYFSGPKNNSEQNNQPLPPQGEVKALPINSSTPTNTDPTVTIRNKTTGEVKQVPKSQEANYVSTPQPQPKVVKASEKALKLSIYVFLASNEKQKNDLISKFSNGSNDLKEAVKNLAVLLDSKPEAIALIEKTIAQDIVNKKSQNEREAIGEYHQKEYERLKSEIDSIHVVTDNAYTGGTQNTITTLPKNPNSTYPNPTQDPKINVYGSAGSYTRYGNTTLGSDGSSYTQYGDTVLGSDGSSYTRYGNTILGNDGSSSTKYGNTTLGNDGRSFTQYGNTTLGSDGSSYTQYGDTVLTRPSY